VVSVVGKNSIETILIYFAAIYYGAVISPINVDESEENIRYILGFVKPKLVLHDVAVTPEACRVEGAATLAYLPMDQSRSGTRGDFFSAVLACTGQYAAPAHAGDSLVEVAFTSGTTSRPKGVCVTRRGLFLMAYEIVDKLGVGEEDVLLEYRNYNWLSSQLLTILSSLISGATLVLGTKFSRSRFPLWLIEKGVTIAAGVPTVINILAEEPVPLTRGDVPRLRFITSSSAPLSTERQQAFERQYGIPVLQMAGMSEAGFMLGNPPQTPRLGAAGTPCKYKDIFFVDAEGERCAPGREGEMVVAGISMALGYLKEDGQIEKFPQSGFRTGDLGYCDEDGYVYITGRAKDLIIRGGVNLSPVEINNRVMTHPLVRDAATIGVPDPIYGEEVACFVVAKEGQSLSRNDVRDHCRSELPEFKVPKRVFFVAAIPKNARGKVAKEALLELLEQPSEKPGSRADAVLDGALVNGAPMH
jgi:acyl-coenzyme A synthetase/AMP-(fatty) acid ligase